jgi:hypothetical protein
MSTGASTEPLLTISAFARRPGAEHAALLRRGPPADAGRGRPADRLPLLHPGPGAAGRPDPPDARGRSLGGRDAAGARGRARRGGPDPAGARRGQGPVRGTGGRGGGRDPDGPRRRARGRRAHGDRRRSRTGRRAAARGEGRLARRRAALRRAARLRRRGGDGGGDRPLLARDVERACGGARWRPANLRAAARGPRASRASGAPRHRVPDGVGEGPAPARGRRWS